MQEMAKTLLILIVLRPVSQGEILPYPIGLYGSLLVPLILFVSKTLYSIPRIP
jgi:hypothetical protein